MLSLSEKFFLFFPPHAPECNFEFLFLLRLARTNKTTEDLPSVYILNKTCDKTLKQVVFLRHRSISYNCGKRSTTLILFIFKNLDRSGSTAASPTNQEASSTSLNTSADGVRHRNLPQAHSNSTPSHQFPYLMQG